MTTRKKSIQEKNILKLIKGKTEKEANKIVASKKMKCRIWEMDGKSIVMTCDFMDNRVNLIIEKNKVKDCFIG